MHGIEDAGFVECTPVQAATLPFGLQGRDIAGQAQTGTGKTAAFLIAIFTLLLRRPRRYKGASSCPRALIVAPTRELAIQIRDEADLLGKHTGLGIHAVYGGVDYRKQLDRLAEGVDILIGTPGRLIDYYKQKVFTLKGTEIFVADEADRMFDMGFIDDLRYLIRHMPEAGERISFLYSATLSFRVLELAYEHMSEVERVVIDAEQITAENIDQIVYHVGQPDKFPLMIGLMEKENPSKALVFVNTRLGAAEIAERLERQGYKAGALIGDLDQRKRIKLLKSFKDGDLQVLVATDVASRGLHIDSVSHVFNYDLPQDPEDYVHRIGRTARAGASGKAISLACERYVYSLEAIEEFVGIRIPHTFADESMLGKPVPRPRQRRSERDDSAGRRSPREGKPAGKRSSGGGRKRGRGESARSAVPAADRQDAAAPAEAAGGGRAGAPVETPGDGGSAGAPKKKPRRRRRRKSGAAGSAASATTAAVVDASD